MSTMRLAVIPARGGSKRIPQKNIKFFCGKPMIVWSIDAALQSGCFDEVVVSTDDDEIANIARASGALIPFIRPAELADDYANTTDVVHHAAKWFVDNGNTPTEVCCIYATAPFLLPTDIQTGLKALLDARCDYSFSVCNYEFPVQRAIRLNPYGRIEMFDPAKFYTRSQDLEEVFHDAGQFYWGSLSAWLQKKIIFASGSVPIKLPLYRVQDIDTPDDWQRAEYLHKLINFGGV